MNNDDFFNLVSAGLIPPAPPDSLSMIDYGATTRRLDNRRFCTDRGMWAIVTLNWTQVLADWIQDRKVLEIMAGAGWLARALSYHHDVDIVATDSQEWDVHHTKMERVHEVEALEATDAILRYHDWADILLVSWPPYGESAIVHACEAWPSDKPIVYIGERDGGCNAPEEFFEHFTRIKPHPDVPLSQWSGLHDVVLIGHYIKRR